MVSEWSVNWTFQGHYKNRVYILENVTNEMYSTSLYCRSMLYKIFKISFKFVLESQVLNGEFR